MPITDDINRTIIEHQKKWHNNAEFMELTEFYTEMQRLGIAKQQAYTLPPLDTIGRQLYHLKSQASTK